MFLVLLAQFSQIISVDQHFLSSFTPTRISKVHASWRLKQTRNFKDFLHTLNTRVASFDLGEKQTQETIFFEVRSSPCLHQPVIENCLFQHAVKQPVKLTSWTIFFAPTSYKKNSIFCRQKKFPHDFIPHFCSFCERFIVLQCSLTQSTCGKSNQFTNLQTHSGLEGILSNYMYLSVQEEGFPVWTSLLLFTVCQPPSVNFDMSNLSPTITHI